MLNSAGCCYVRGWCDGEGEIGWCGLKWNELAWWGGWREVEVGWGGGRGRMRYNNSSSELPSLLGTSQDWKNNGS